MTSGMKVVVYPVKDLDRAKTLYGALLGVTPYVDQPYYVGFRLEGVEVGLDPRGHSQGIASSVNYWQVVDIKKSVDLLVGLGAVLQQAITDVGGGRLVATVRDADGNVTGLMQS